MSDQESGENATDYNTPESRKPPQFTEEDRGEEIAYLGELLQEKPRAKGLAIVIGTPNAKGAVDDVENVSSTFNKLGFVVWRRHIAATLKVICRMIQSAAQHTGYGLSCRYIVFYFAGHGGSHDGHSFIKPHTLDGEKETKLFIKEGIIDPFSPQQAPHLTKDRYRLFFFDCCLSDPTRAAPSRRPQGNLPAGANTLVAYATSMDYKSQGYNGTGGIWTNTLCKNLMLDLPITAILDITCDEVINESIINHGNQSPHYISSVGILCLKSNLFTWNDFIQGLPQSTNTLAVSSENRSQQSAAHASTVGNEGRSQQSAGITYKDLLSKEPKKHDVLNILRLRSADWRAFATAFGLDDNFSTGLVRKGVQSTDEEKLEEVLREWKDTQCSDVTWRKVLEVLRERRQNKMAGEVKDFLERDEVKEKYKKEKDFQKYDFDDL